MTITEQLMTRFQGMIIGVHTSPNLTEEEKDYICNLLSDQLRIETECAEMALDTLGGY